MRISHGQPPGAALLELLLDELLEELEEEELELEGLELADGLALAAGETELLLAWIEAAELLSAALAELLSAALAELLPAALAELLPAAELLTWELASELAAELLLAWELETAEDSLLLADAAEARDEAWELEEDSATELVGSLLLELASPLETELLEASEAKLEPTDELGEGLLLLEELLEEELEELETKSQHAKA